MKSIFVLTIALLVGFAAGRLSAPRAVQLPEMAKMDFSGLHTEVGCFSSGQNWTEGIGADGSMMCHIDPARRVPVKPVSKS